MPYDIEKRRNPLDQCERALQAERRRRDVLKLLIRQAHKDQAPSWITQLSPVLKGSRARIQTLSSRLTKLRQRSSTRRGLSELVTMRSM